MTEKNISIHFVETWAARSETLFAVLSSFAENQFFLLLPATILFCSCVQIQAELFKKLGPVAPVPERSQF